METKINSDVSFFAKSFCNEKSNFKFVLSSEIKPMYHDSSQLFYCGVSQNTHPNYHCKLNTSPFTLAPCSTLFRAIKINFWFSLKNKLDGHKALLQI